MGTVIAMKGYMNTEVDTVTKRKLRILYGSVNCMCFGWSSQGRSEQVMCEPNSACEVREELCGSWSKQHAMWKKQQTQGHEVPEDFGCLRSTKEAGGTRKKAAGVKGVISDHTGREP